MSCVNVRVYVWACRCTSDLSDLVPPALRHVLCLMPQSLLHVSLWGLLDLVHLHAQAKAHHAGQALVQL